MVSVNGIIEQVAEFYGVDRDDILNGNRRHIFSEPRHVAMYLCHRLLGMSKEAIAANFGKNRTLVTYAVTKVCDWVEDPRFNRKAAECAETIMWNNSNEKK
jgi:chromosomal replication initiation ATPase DnaA